MGLFFPGFILNVFIGMVFWNIYFRWMKYRRNKLLKMLGWGDFKNKDQLEGYASGLKHALDLIELGGPTYAHDHMIKRELDAVQKTQAAYKRIYRGVVRGRLITDMDAERRLDIFIERLHL